MLLIEVATIVHKINRYKDFSVPLQEVSLKMELRQRTLKRLFYSFALRCVSVFVSFLFYIDFHFITRMPKNVRKLQSIQ